MYSTIIEFSNYIKSVVITSDAKLCLSSFISTIFKSANYNLFDYYKILDNDNIYIIKYVNLPSTVYSEKVLALSKVH